MPGMTDGAIHQVSADIGGLKASVEMLMTTWQAQEKSATDGRRSLHDKFDLLSKDVIRLTAEVENLAKDLGVIKPAIDAFKTARDRQDGAQWMGKLVWGAFLGLAGVAGGFVVEFFHIRPPGH
jgi:outer membrane murein-binding lipoprotein Lpp